MADELVSVNLTDREIQEYLDTGFMPPMVVMPRVVDQFHGLALGVYCMASESGKMRIGSGGEVRWRKLFSNPANWLYVARVDLDLVAGDEAKIEGVRPVDEVNTILMKEHDTSMHFVDGVALIGHSAGMKTPDEWKECSRGVAQQFADVWLTRDFHSTLRMREKMLRHDCEMKAEDWWVAAGPVIESGKAFLREDPTADMNW